MDPGASDLLWPYLPFALLLAATWATGTALERLHLRDLRIRERRTRRLPALTLPRPPAHWQVEESALVSGSVVVSIDYFRRFVGLLHAIVGGRVRAFESALDRGRREALQRMKEEAQQRGLHAVLNVRMVTSHITSGLGNGEGTAGVELLAFGTGLRLRQPDRAGDPPRGGRRGLA